MNGSLTEKEIMIDPFWDICFVNNPHFIVRVIYGFYKCFFSKLKLIKITQPRYMFSSFISDNDESIILKNIKVKLVKHRCILIPPYIKEFD